MATIEDLQPSITSMSEIKALELVKELRALRRILKPKPHRKKSTTKKSKAKQKQLSVDEILSSMSKEQVEAFIKKMKGKNNG